MNQPDIPQFLDKRPFVGTYTILSTYGNCPHQMAHRYIWKTMPYEETPEMAWGNTVHTAFEHRVGSMKPLPVDAQAWDKGTKRLVPFNMQQWESFAAPFDGLYPLVEQKLGITAQGAACGYWDANCWFRGKADCAVVKGETAYINDWKTGGSKYEDPFELATNAVLLHARNPKLKKIIGSYTWLAEGRLSQMYDLSDTKQTWNEMCKLMAEILDRKRKNEFEKKRSGLCKGWCGVEICENWQPKT